MKIKKIIASMIGIIAVFVLAVNAYAANSTVIVSPSNQEGWIFNPDVTYATPYGFNNDKSSIGDGSLNVMPIGTNPLHKFIAIKTLNVPVADTNSISYDFLIAGNGTVADANQFYLNVYTNIVGSMTFYDCRFDYAPTVGSTTVFTTASFDAGDAPTFVADRAGGITCPTTLAGMPAGSNVKFIALNVGDTSNSDTGLAGYLDKAVIDTTGSITTYDFELNNVPLSKDQCKKDGYKSLTASDGNVFKNQGQCVSYFNNQ